MLLNRLSIKWRILVIFIALVVFPTVLFLIIYTETYADDLTDSIINEKLAIVRQMNKNIYNRFSTYENLTMMLYHNEQLKAYIDGTGLKPDGEAAIQQYLNSLINSEKYLVSATLCIGEDMYTAGYRYNNIGDYIGRHEPAVAAEKGRTVWIPTEIMSTSYYKKSNSFAVARAVNAPDRDVGSLWLFLSDRFFEDVLYEEDMGNIASSCIIAPGGRIVASSDRALTGSLMRQVYPNDIFSKRDGYLTELNKTSGEREIIVFSTSQQTNWSIITAVPEREILKGVEHIRRFSVIIALVYAVSILLTYLFLSRTVFRPLSELSRAMGKVSEGNFNSTLQRRNNDEIGRLVDSYNYMLQKIGALIIEIRNEEKAKNDEKMKLLSMQIGPHFIYNTLNTIKWMASINKQTNIKKVVEALIRLMMCVTYNTHELIPLCEEIELIRCYSYIQKVRYMNFEIEYNIDKSAESCLINKLILQPIVENSILYGFTNQPDSGLITISASIQDCLVITVTDNGKGFDTRALPQDKSAEKKTADHIGISNVIERIRLHHGEQYGMTIKSEAGRGTKVTFRFPVLKGDASDD